MKPDKLKQWGCRFHALVEPGLEDEYLDCIEESSFEDRMRLVCSDHARLTAPYPSPEPPCPS